MIQSSLYRNIKLILTDGDTVAIWFYTSKDDVAELLQTTAKDLWFYDKIEKSPYIPKDETLYGLYMATVIKSDNKNHEFKNFAKAEEAFEKGELPVNLQCTIGNKVTTYGREKLTKICNIDINKFLKYNKQIEEWDEVILLDANSQKISEEDIKKSKEKDTNVFILPKRVKGEPDTIYKQRRDKIKEKYDEKVADVEDWKKFRKSKHYVTMNAIGLKNIGEFILVMGTHPNRVQEYLEMQQFAVKIATMIGLGTIPYIELFNRDQKAIDDILNKEYTGENTIEAKTAEAMERKNSLRKVYEKELEKALKKLSYEKSNIRELQQSLGKYSLGKLMTVYCPSINYQLTLNLFNCWKILKKTISNEYRIIKNLFYNVQRLTKSKI